MYIRTDIVEFSTCMETGMLKHDNDWGDGWKDMTFWRAKLWFDKAVGKLIIAIFKHDQIAVCQQCADIANFCMMMRFSCLRKGLVGFPDV